jgi:ribosomal protein S13
MKNSQILMILAAMVAMPLALQGAMRASEAAAQSELRREARIQELADDGAGRLERMLELANTTRSLETELKTRIEEDRKVAKNWETVDR